jgi:hypothetical protein
MLAGSWPMFDRFETFRVTLSRLCQYMLVEYLAQSQLCLSCVVMAQTELGKKKLVE